MGASFWAILLNSPKRSVSFFTSSLMEKGLDGEAPQLDERARRRVALRRMSSG